MHGKTINGFELKRLLGIASMAEVWSSEKSINHKNYMKLVVVATAQMLFLWPATVFGGNLVETDSLSGVFSISPTQKVFFSKGNLQYQPSTNTWRFALNQWDFIGGHDRSDIEIGNIYEGEMKCSNNEIAETYSGWIDLFGWGTGDDPTQVFTMHGCSTFVDWGSKYGFGWRTLTKNEWRYLLEERSTISGMRYAKAKVNGVNGLIILPDNWYILTYVLYGSNDKRASFSSNLISADTWNTSFSPAGAVFLPAAGHREMNIVYDAGSWGSYWSSSPSNDVVSCDMTFREDNLTYYNDDRRYGLSVRLVLPIE